MSGPQTPDGHAPAGFASRVTSRRLALSAAAVGAAALAAAAAIGLSGGATRSSSGASFTGLTASAAPAGWHSATLPDGAVLSYPPSMLPVRTDDGTASVAQLSPAGSYLLYLNATPRQGGENLSNWAAYRLSHLREDDARSVRELAAASGVRFQGGTGSCVVDTYVTKVGGHHYTELACLVQGSRAASVVVAAAPAASWSGSASLLDRAVAAYQVR
jgi:hypothetical protein